jgi:hypothetical protein
MNAESDPSPIRPTLARVTLFEEPLAGGVRCTVCPHLCVIGENLEGLCKARGVRDGRLVTLT